MIKEYLFRIQAADWDFGGDVGTQKALCYHQFFDNTGNIVTTIDADGEPTVAGTWEPFLPGPEIRGNVGDEIHVRIQNRIDNTTGDFVDSLKSGAIVHWHGLELANAHDGTPVTQKPIASGEDFVYKYILHRPGIFWYHPHFNGLVQEHLGCYGPIIVEDDITHELRETPAPNSQRVIPHQDRTFQIALSDVSFQDGQSSDPPASHVPVANIASSTATLRIRDIMNVMNVENLGDVMLINGIHETPFNDPNGNFQQFWANGGPVNPPSIMAQQGESMAFQIFNMGLHRFYKIELVFKAPSNADPTAWVHSDGLIWIGGQGGMLDEARNDGGVYETNFGGTTRGWRLRGRKGREAGAGSDGNGEPPLQEQMHSELSLGEHIIPTSARIMVAFEVGNDWTEVALRASGFSVASNLATDVEPMDMEIAHFNVGSSPNPNFVLNAPLAAGTALRTNPNLTAPSAQEDLSVTPDPIVISSPCSHAQLSANGVPVPAAADFTASYDPVLVNAGGPGIDNDHVHWMPTGPEQPTFANTRYVNIHDVVEWTVETQSSMADHPWHMHGFSFQPIRMELVPDPTDPNQDITLYEWDFTEYVDSIYVPYGHRLTFRMRVEDRMYVGEDGTHVPGGAIGRWLAHCHITKHAHRGMMMNFIVTDGCSVANRPHVDGYLRDYATDDGSEPSVGSVWQSPDIIMTPFESTDPNMDYGPGSGTENDNTLGEEAELGNDNYLYVRANNRGNQPAIMTADLYWSEASTLLSPSSWNYLGTTDPMTVDPGTLTVSDPAVVWASVDNPLPLGHHACLIAVAGSEQESKPISVDEVPSYTSVTDFNTFSEFVRSSNNVAWRNFNVVNDVLNFAEKRGFLPVIIRGAWDKTRLFDINVDNPFEHAILELPFSSRLLKQLEPLRLKMEANKRHIQIFMPPRERFRLPALALDRGRDYRSRIYVRDDPERLLGQTISIAQFHVDRKQDDTRLMKLKLNALEHQLHAERHATSFRHLLNERNKLSELLKEQITFEKEPEKAPREEVGRVSWFFTKPRKKPPSVKDQDERKSRFVIDGKDLDSPELKLNTDQAELAGIVEQMARMLKKRM